MYLIALGFSALCFLGVGIYFLRSPMFSVFHPMTFYLAFHGLIFVIRPCMVYVSGHDVMYRVYQFTPSLSDKMTVLFASNLGFLVFSFFCLRNGNLPMRFSASPAIEEERLQLSKIFVWVLLLLGPLALYSLVRSYGPGSLYDGLEMDRSTGIVVNTTNVGYVLDLQMMAVSLTALTAWILRFRLYSLLPIAGFVLMRAGQGGRGPFVTAVVAAGLFYLYDKRLKAPRLGVFLGALLLVAGFNAVGADRGAALRQTAGFEQKDDFEKAEGNSEFFLYGMDFANMEFFEYLVYAIPQRSGTYDYFLDNLQVFTEPVPRIWWSGKPIGEPLRRIDLYKYGFPIGMTRSMPGEGWYALGWLGVVLWCAMWGTFLGQAYRKFVSKPQTTWRVSCYLILLATLVVGFRDGTLLQLVRSTGVYFTPIAVWYLLARAVGLPSAAELASVYAMRARTAAARLAHGDPTVPAPEPGQMAALPPAVRRRRLALARINAATPAE